MFPQPVYNNGLVSTHSVDSPTHFQNQPNQQTFPVQYGIQHPMQAPVALGSAPAVPAFQHYPCYDYQPPAPQPQYNMVPQQPQFAVPQPLVPMNINMEFAPHLPPAHAVYHTPNPAAFSQQLVLAASGFYSGVTPTGTHQPFLFPVAPFQHPIDVPANMQAFGAVHGQIVPVMKDEGSAVSNASSESGLTSDISPPVRGELVKKRSPRQAPPGFDNIHKEGGETAERRQNSYAKAAKTRLTSIFNPRSKRPIGKQEKKKSAPSVKRAPKALSPRRPMNSHHRRKPKKKYGFRSKQNKIDEVHGNLVRKYTDLGILASDREVLRGEDTIRIHCKKYAALQQIEVALEQVEALPHVAISRVSLPLSQKNQFQKKGFLVYVQVEDVSMVPDAKRKFQEFDAFRKCEVAKQTTAPVNNSVPSAGEVAPSKAPAIEVEELVKTEPAIGELATFEDPDCGSLIICGLSLETPLTGSPDFAPAEKWFEDDHCGLGLDLDLGVLDMCPKISIGEAGQ